MLVGYECFHTVLLRNLQLRCWRFFLNTQVHIHSQGNQSPLIKEQWWLFSVVSVPQEGMALLVQEQPPSSQVNVTCGKI